MPSHSAITASAFSPRSGARPQSSGPRPTGRRAASIPAPVEPPLAAKEEASVKTESKTTTETSATSAIPEKSAPKKLRRSRVPGNLAQMYGESQAKRDLESSPAAEPEKKPRRDAKTRELRRAVMQVDDTLLQRLSQSAAAALVVGEDEAPARRGRTWQEACGKCGTRSTFRTAGALCPTCGAICLRDAAQ